MKRVYISGKMTGLPEFNYPAFHEASKRWRNAGWAVQNPAELGGPDLTKPWSVYMIVDLVVIMLATDALAMIPGWETSTGAKIELLLGRMLGKEIYCAKTMRPLEVNMHLVVFEPATNKEIWMKVEPK